jgi:glycopeptide antibiotics resistance protein
MNWRKAGQIVSISNLFLYLVAMVMPRTLPFEGFSEDHAYFVKKVFHEILYYSGPFEPVANFLFLIPTFLILLISFPKIRPALSLSLCIALSAASEILQIFIPGRVSSLQDFVLNSLGALSAFLIYKFASSPNSLQ